MKTAIDSFDGQKITAQNYLVRWGHKALGTYEDQRPQIFCEVCEQTLHHVAGRTRDSDGHFAHHPKSGFCPTKNPAALPYGRLTPTNPDPERAKWIRSQAMQHWQWIFHEVWTRCPNFDAYEFIELVKVADADGLWGYRNLTLLQVPELFLVSRDFTPLTSKFRTAWYRFWFSANIRSIDELWITPPENVQLLRAEFPAPKGRQKTPYPHEIKDVSRCQPIMGIHENVKIREFAARVIPEALGIK